MAGALGEGVWSPSHGEVQQEADVEGGWKEGSDGQGQRSEGREPGSSFQGRASMPGASLGQSVTVLQSDWLDTEAEIGEMTLTVNESS